MIQLKLIIKKLNNSKAFTLIELLLVLIIISVLTGVVIVVSKPTDILQKSRDSKRQSDLKKINTAIEVINSHDQSLSTLSNLSPNTLYLSLKDSSSTCGNYLSQLPSLPSGWSYRCSATPTDITGQGWLPIPFSSNPLINISNLLIDPINKPPYYYTFTANDQGYELTAKKENKDEEIIVSNAPIRLTPISRGGSNTWIKAYGGNNDDIAYSISPTSDGGYIVAGYTGPYSHYDILIIKLNSSGDIQWSRVYGANTNSFINRPSISQTSDGGYIVSADTYIAGRLYDILILKLDSSGNLQWAKTYGGSDSDYNYSISQTSDGGYVVSANTWSYGAGYSDILILKLDSSGNLQWAKTYGGSYSDYASSVSQTSDGGYIVAGYNGDVLLLKTDSSGNLQWAKKYDGGGDDISNSIYLSSDGGYVIAGATNSYSSSQYYYEFLIFKTDSSGNLQWAKTYHKVRSDYFDYAYSISQTLDGGYIVTGYTSSYFGYGLDILILKINSSGNLQWAKTYGGSDSDKGYAVIQTSDGYYVVVGLTFSSSIDFLVLKIDSSGNINNCSLLQSINPSSASPGLSVSIFSPSVTSPSLSIFSSQPSSTSPSLSSWKFCPL